MKFKYSYILVALLLLALGLFFVSVYQKPTIAKVAPSITVQSESEASAGTKISTLILSPDDLVSDKRQSLINTVKGLISPPDTVILVSGSADSNISQITVSDKDWRTKNGNLKSSKNLADKLAEKNLAVVNQGAFSANTNDDIVADDIFTNFPSSKLLPVIIPDNSSKDTLDAFETGLTKVCLGNCLMVVSSDSSIGQLPALAEIHDSSTLKALNNLDANSILQSEVQSKGSYYLALKWSTDNGADKFNLVENTNSGLIAKNRDEASNSSIFGWFEFGRPNAVISDELSFILGGDVMFDRGIDASFRGQKLYDLWSNFGTRVFEGMDLSMVNLEGPISPTEIPIDTSTDNLNFNFPPLTPNVLSWLNINTVGLANNHTLNNGTAGFANTVKAISDQKVTPLGRQNYFGDSSIKLIDNGDAKLAVFAIESLESHTDLTPYIAKEKTAGYKVLIFTHWGTEYADIHNLSQEKLAHSWIDAGADIIIGSHPHVIEDAEVYKGKPIFYSLGNLVFDQTFSTQTQQGLIIAGVIKGDKLKLTLLPTIQKNLKPEIMTGDDRTAVISKLRSGLGMLSTDAGIGFDQAEF